MDKISVQDFIKQYNLAKSDSVKNGLVDKIIKRKYCPITDKKLILQLMLDKSIVEKNGLKHIDMFVHRINFYMALIVLYTKLTINKDDQGNPLSFEAYDLLRENGIFDVLCEKIGEQEISELTLVSQLLMDTYYNENNRMENSILNVINTFLKKIESISDYDLKKISEFIEKK